jgi:tRNA-dihydrouridine synthase
MIGRRAIGYPAIFTEIACYLAGRPLPLPDFNQRMATMRRFVLTSVSCLGEVRTARLMRTRLAWFAKGMRNSAEFRQAAGRIDSIAAALELIEAYRQAGAAAAEDSGTVPITSAAPCHPPLRPTAG